MGYFFTRLIVHFIFLDLRNQIFSINFQDNYFYRGIWVIYQRTYPQLFVDKLWITIFYVVKRVVFWLILYVFCTVLVRF